MDRIVKGIWIPIEIWQNRSLSWNEKILLMEIDSFTAKDHECYISNEYIAELLGVSVSWASKCLSHLLELGLVRVVKFDGRKRYVESTIQFKADLNESSMQDGTKVPYTNNNEYINNNNSLYKKGSSRFQKPTIEEIREYCLEKGYNVDAEQFFDFYESKGWLVGKSQMKDWKAAVRTWEHRKPETTRTPFSPRQKKSVFEQNLEVIDQMFGTDMHSKAYGKKEVYDEQ